MAWLDELFRKMVADGASDLHLSSGLPPKLRLHGDIIDVPGVELMDAETLLEVLHEITPEHNRAQYEAEWDTDFAYELKGVARFRVNLFMDRNGPGAVFRQIPTDVLTLEQLGMPKVVTDLCYLSKGLVLVTGPTGSGKSTTLAAMIDHINRHRSDHIITIEDPIEFVHRNQRCLINQREVHRHTQSFKRALRAALREDPDIVLVGEMRDLETIEIAIETAETGHLVFGTLHTTTAPSTVDRIIDQFPADRQSQVRTMLSSSLKGVIAQTLCKKKPRGRAAALEIMIGTTAVAANIREGKTHQIVSAMQIGAKQGMRLLNDSLYDLVKSGLVDPSEAYVKAVNKEELVARLTAEGIQVDLSRLGDLQDPAAAPQLQVAAPAPSAPSRGPQSAPRAALPFARDVKVPVAPAHAPEPASAPQPAAKPWVDPFDQFKKKQRG